MADRSLGNLKAAKWEKKGMRMDHGNRRKALMLRCLKVGALAFLAVFFLVSAHPGVAGDVKVVKGIVGTVAGNLIYLNGNSFDLTGIPVRNPSGKELSIEDIAPGKKVELYYRRGRVSSVLVYEPMVE
jgi:hypothetical protein